MRHCVISSRDGGDEMLLCVVLAEAGALGDPALEALGPREQGSPALPLVPAGVAVSSELLIQIPSGCMRKSV